MPDTLSQTNAIYAKAARSAALRRARLLREKALRRQQRLQLQARLVVEQAALIRDRTIVNEHLGQQRPNSVISLVTSFCREYYCLFALYLVFILLYYYGVYLLRRYQ